MVSKLDQSVEIRQNLIQSQFGNGTRWQFGAQHFIERLWRSVKYEELHLREYRNMLELEAILGNWFKLYNTWRPHDALGGARPWEVYRPKTSKQAA